MDGRGGHGSGGDDGGTITCLYVDDDEALLSLTQDYVESQYDRFVIETAMDAEQGLAMLEARSFDAVVSDYQMPGMDGLEFLRTVREERGDDVPFVIFTGQGREAVAMEALNLGADRYLQKGGDPTSQYGVLARAIEQEVDHHRTDRRLREREEHLRITLESIGDAVVATDAEGRVERMNGVAERLTGWDRANAAGRPLSEVFEIYDQETGEPASNPVEEVLASGETVGLANGTRLVARDGTERYIGDSAAPIQRADGEIQGVVLVFRDVSERYETRRRQRRQQRALVDLSTDPAVVDGDFGAACRRITERAADVLDVDRTSVWLFDDDTLRCTDLYRRPSDVHESGATLDADEFPRYFEALERLRAIDADDVYTDERTAELTPYFEANDVRSLLDGTVRADGGVVGVVCCESVGEAREWADDEVRFAAELADQVDLALLNQDRREREHDLARTTRQLSHLFEQSPLAVVEWTLDFRVDRWNDRAEEIFGYTEREARDRHGSFVVPEGVRDDIDGVWADLVADGEPDHRINENVTKDGETIHCEWHNRPVTDDDGEVVSVLSLVRDVTEEKKRDRQFRAFAENTREIVYIKDTDGRYEFINEAGADYFDRTPEAVVGCFDGELFDLEDDRALLPTDEAVLSTETPRTVEVTQAIDGEEYVFLSDKRPHYDENGHLQGLVGISRDITGRKRLENLLEAFYAVATDGDLAFEDRIGELLETLCSELGLASGFLARTRPTEDRYEIVTAGGPGARAGAGEVYDLRGTFCRHVVDSGEVLTVDDVEADGYAEDPGHAAFGFECYVGAPVYVDGAVWGTLCLADRDADAGPIGEMGTSMVELVSEWVGQEITNWQHERELRRQNDALEDVVSVLSHDLKSPLGVAKGRLELAREAAGGCEHLAEATRTLDELETLVDDALTLAEQGWEIDDPERVDLGAASRRAWDNLTAEGATLEVDAGAELFASERGLVSILQNLFENAATHAEAPVTVSVGAVADAEGFYVADDGPGIPADEREAVFEHGHTTSDDGTGLGLTIVERVADAHDWSIRVIESEAGGARFEFTSREMLAE
ncbi:PAS domain-containing protein [Natronomonas salina]|uniref:PAS domain-containing protein n=1 Tax=Natronomonas salina TaxID=1710540 RepID=UPI0015B45446|nr:PAS domain-containing protein [Natronomonas salina]QLD90140.1 PAS domain-containing protein [Natronomonas salina]